MPLNGSLSNSEKNSILCWIDEVARAIKIEPDVYEI
jgi:hypothetical protein